LNLTLSGLFRKRKSTLVAVTHEVVFQNRRKYGPVFVTDAEIVTFSKNRNAFFCLFLGPFIFSNERNKNNKMHKLMRRLIYYCSITPTCFGPLVEAIIRELQIREGCRASMAICWNVVTGGMFTSRLSNTVTVIPQQVTKGS
jgi:hypothetical protein